MQPKELFVPWLYIRRARWPTGWLKWLAATFRMVFCFADMYILAAAVAAGWFVSPKRPNQFSASHVRVDTRYMV